MPQYQVHENENELTDASFCRHLDYTCRPNRMKGGPACRRALAVLIADRSRQTLTANSDRHIISRLGLAALMRAPSVRMREALSHRSLDNAT